MPAWSATAPLPWDSLAPGLGTGRRGGGSQFPRMGSVLPISHHLGLSLSWRMFPSLCCPCTKGWLLMQGWPCSAKWGRVGRTAGGDGGWGLCPVAWAVSEQSFVFSHKIRPIFQRLAETPGSHCLVQSWPPWGGMIPWCQAASDPSHHDPEIKPRTDTFPDGTRSPGNSQDLERGSSAWWRPCWGSPPSQLSRESLGLPTPWSALTASPTAPGAAAAPSLPVEPPFPVGDQNKHLCGEVHCSGARNK